MKKNIVLKVSGYFANGGIDSAYDVKLIKKTLEEAVMPIAKHGKVYLVIGGGNIWRGAYDKDSTVHKSYNDGVGIIGSISNALMVSGIATNLGMKVTTVIPSNFSIAMKNINIVNYDEASLGSIDSDIIIFGGGIGKEGYTTDTVTSLIGASVDAAAILWAKNGTNGIYNLDPNKKENLNDLIFYDELTYDFIIENKLKIFDQVAAKTCMDNNIQSIVFNGGIAENIRQAAEGVLYNKEMGFQKTIVKNFK